jgi:hypothetical protein
LYEIFEEKQMQRVVTFRDVTEQGALWLGSLVKMKWLSQGKKEQYLKACSS